MSTTCSTPPIRSRRSGHPAADPAAAVEHPDRAGTDAARRARARGDARVAGADRDARATSPSGPASSSQCSGADARPSSRRGGRVAVREELRSAPAPRSRRWRRPRGRAPPAPAGSPGSARAPRARAPSPASRRGAARRGRGGSRCARGVGPTSPPTSERLLREHRPRQARRRVRRRPPARRAGRRPGPRGRLRCRRGSRGRRRRRADRARADARRTPAWAGSAASISRSGARGAQVLAGLDDAGGHAGLGGLAPGARVVGLLVADLAVDLQHAVVVLEHVVDDRAGEGVLGVGVDVHLHDAVVDAPRGSPTAASRSRRGRRGRTACSLPYFAPTASWISLRISGRELDVARLVDAVHVAEGQRRRCSGPFSPSPSASAVARPSSGVV